MKKFIFIVTLSCVITDKIFFGEKNSVMLIMRSVKVIDGSTGLSLGTKIANGYFMCFPIEKINEDWIRQTALAYLLVKGFIYNADDMALIPNAFTQLHDDSNHQVEFEVHMNEDDLREAFEHCAEHESPLYTVLLDLD